MAGHNNYQKGKGPKPIAGVFAIPCEGEQKQPGVRYEYPEYSEEIAEEILTRLEAGNSFRQIEMLVGMPSRRVMNRWRAEHPEFDKQVILACDAGDDVIADEIKAIADTPLIGERVKRVKFKSGPEGVETWTSDNVDRSRLMVMSRQWLLTKKNKRYSDKVQQEHTGPNGAELKPFTVVVSSVLDRDESTND